MRAARSQPVSDIVIRGGIGSDGLPLDQDNPFSEAFVPKCNACYRPSDCTTHVCNRPCAHPGDYCECRCGERMPYWRTRSEKGTTP